jgi:hypothetical protein
MKSGAEILQVLRHIFLSMVPLYLIYDLTKIREMKVLFSEFNRTTNLKTLLMRNLGSSNKIAYLEFRNLPSLGYKIQILN